MSLSRLSSEEESNEQEDTGNSDAATTSGGGIHDDEAILAEVCTPAEALHFSDRIRN